MCYTDKKRRQCYTTADQNTHPETCEKWRKLKHNMQWEVPAGQHSNTRRLNIPWAFSYSLCFCHILFLAARSLLAILFQNGSSFQWLLGCRHIAAVLTDLNLLLKKRHRHHHHWQSPGEQPMDLQTLHWCHSSTAACPERGQVSQRPCSHLLLSHTLWNCSLELFKRPG